MHSGQASFKAPVADSAVPLPPSPPWVGIPPEGRQWGPEAVAHRQALGRQAGGQGGGGTPAGRQGGVWGGARQAGRQAGRPPPMHTLGWP